MKYFSKTLLRILPMVLFVTAVLQVAHAQKGKKKAQKQRIERYAVPLNADTSIILINIADLGKDGAAEILNFLADKDVKAIVMHTVFTDEDGDDLEFVRAMQNVTDKIVLNDNSLGTGKIPSYLLGFDYGPGLMYADDNDVITSFALNYKTDNGTNIESFYLKLMRKVNPAYKQHVGNAAAYKIHYLGNKTSFLWFADPTILEEATIPSAWKDKIVLIGYLGNEYTFPIEFVSDDIDAYFTPTSREGVPEGMPNMYSTVITANIVSYLLRNYPK